ncbi:hypothetical protein BKA65DRAFT_575122 [Rhexocercosporidium sp. MPI-PUGE-AT-0058]|nr:hypothetical protein BKA65DRAFT_575122 [Rhexocercosporidium sp. MPI-PUGE-AT-0058]
MSATATFNPTTNAAYSPGSDDSSRGKSLAPAFNPAPLPTSSTLRAPAGGLLKGATDENGQLKAAALMVGIKLDLEAEVHLTARVRGDITIGLY